MKEQRRPVIYVRVSTLRQAGEDRVSLPDQAEHLRAKAAQEGWEIVQPDEPLPGLPEGVYGDPGITGDTVEGRPGLCAALAMIEEGRADSILVKTEDRLARRESAFGRIWDRLEAAGAWVLTPSMQYNTADPTHATFFHLAACVGASHWKRMMCYTMATKKEYRAKQGEFVQRTDPFGYSWQKGEKGSSGVGCPVVNEEEAEVVRLIFRLADEERMSNHGIADELNRRGIPTRGNRNAAQGKGAEAGALAKWRECTIGAILTNPNYKGVWRTWPTKSRELPKAEETRRRRRRGVKPDPKAEIVYAKNPPEALVSAAQFDRVQRLVRSPIKRTRRKLTGMFALQGKLLCGECGYKVTGYYPRRGYRYYRCSHASRGDGCDHSGNSRAGALERAVWHSLVEWASDPERQARYLEETQGANLEQWREDVARYARTLETVKQKRDRLEEAYLAGDFTRDRFHELRDTLDLDIVAWAEQIEANDNRIAEAEEQGEEHKSLVGLAEEIAYLGDFDAVPFDVVRDTIQKLPLVVQVFADRQVKIGLGGEVERVLVQPRCPSHTPML